MKLSEAAAKYVAHKQTMGMRFCTEGRILKSFCRAMGDITITEVRNDRVSHFVAGRGPVTLVPQSMECFLAFTVRFSSQKAVGLRPHPEAVCRHTARHETVHRIIVRAGPCPGLRRGASSAVYALPAHVYGHFGGALARGLPSCRTRGVGGLPNSRGAAMALGPLSLMVEPCE